MNYIIDNWTERDYNDFLNELKALSDEKYKKFHTSLIPNSDKNFFIGVRMPVMREIGKKIAKGNARSFLDVVKNNFYEEKIMRAVVIGQLKTESYDEFLSLCDGFVGCIDSWAVCDCFCSSLKRTKRYKKQFFEHVCEYTQSDNPWIVRAGLVLMLDYYLDEEHIDAVLMYCDNAQNDHYCVSMARAWLVAEAMVKCREHAIEYMQSNALDDATFNKAVQKCVESYRVDNETKMYLKSLKRY